jgi:hypothetical protein
VHVWIALGSEHRKAANEVDSERDHKSEKGILMVWLLIAASIYAIIFVAGRAHSRYLDRLEARYRQTCVSAPTADNRTFNHGIRLVPDEAELHEAYAELAAEVRGVANITNSKEERGGRKIEPASAPLGANTAIRSL